MGTVSDPTFEVAMPDLILRI